MGLSRFFICVTLAVAANTASAAFQNPDTKVETLNDDNFYAFVQKSYDKPAIVEFYAPWCGHCKAFAPTFDKAATKFSDDAHFGAIDATSHRDIAVEHHVKGYPTVLWFNKGGKNFRKYSGPQTLEGIGHLVHSLVSDPVEAARSDADVAQFRAANPISYVYYASDDSDNVLAASGLEAFTSACAALQDITDCIAVANLPRSKIPNGLSVAAVRHETFKVHGKAEEADPIILPLDGTVPIKQEHLGDVVTKWMDRFHLPLVTEVVGRNFAQVTHAGKITVLIPCADENMAQEIKARVYPAVHPVTANKDIVSHLQEFNFGTFVLDDDRAIKYMSTFGVSVDALPQLVAVDYERERFYHEAGYGATREGVSAFLKDIDSGKIPEQGLTLMATFDMRWDKLVAYLPFLRPLNALPRFSLMMGSVVIVLGIVFWSILSSDADAVPPSKPTSKKADAKTESTKAASKSEAEKPKEE